MESSNSPDYEKVSPSQENTAHLQSVKRDGESLEDFEDITKDDPFVKDMTAQFLEHEIGSTIASNSNEFLYESDKDFHFDQENSDNPKYSSNDLKNELAKDFQNLDVKEGSTRNTDCEDSFNELFNFEQTDDTQAKFGENKEQITGKPIMNILDENMLIDIGSTDEVYITGSDDLSFIPKKGESSPVLYSEVEEDIPKKPPSECRSSEATDSIFNSQPLSKFTSEPGVNREQEPEKLLGDGLHVKQNIEGDGSDDDDFVPEPIPKDYPEISATEGKQFLAAMGLDTWFYPDLLHPKVESLIYWRDPKKSGVVFGAVLIILLSLTSFSLISVAAYTSLIALVAALAFRIYKSVMQAVQKTSEGHPFKKYLVAVLDHPILITVFNIIEEYLDIDLTVNPDKAREISDVVVSYVNSALTEFRRLFLIEDVIDSIKFGVFLWSMTYIGAWFNGLSLLIIAFVGLFTLPKVYENNKTQIDANIDIVRTKINEVTEKVTAVIPLGKKTEEIKDKSE